MNSEIIVALNENFNFYQGLPDFGTIFIGTRVCIDYFKTNECVEGFKSYHLEFLRYNYENPTFLHILIVILRIYHSIT